MTNNKAKHVAFYQASLMRGELGTPVMQGFEGLNDEINRIADSYPGIFYRFKDPEKGNGLNHRVYFPEHPLIISQVLVAQSPRTLAEFGNAGLHRKAKIEDSSKYFDKDGLKAILPRNMVLWFVNQGETPNLIDGRENLYKLIREGPSEKVFTFREALGVRNGAR